MDVLRGWNNELQDRLRIAEKLQPVHMFHRVQADTVCEVLGKLLQVKEVKKEEVFTKDDEIKELGT